MKIKQADKQDFDTSVRIQLRGHLNREPKEDEVINSENDPAFVLGYLLEEIEKIKAFVMYNKK